MRLKINIEPGQSDRLQFLEVQFPTGGMPEYTRDLEHFYVRVSHEKHPLHIVLTLKPRWWEKLLRWDRPQHVFLWEPIFKEWLRQTKGCMVKMVKPDEKRMLRHLVVAANLREAYDDA